MNKDKFFVYGRVHPSEYDWKVQFSELAKIHNKTHEPYIVMDVGKVMGLCKYVEELEDQLKLL